MAKHSYNTKLKEYRRHTSRDNLEKVQTAYKEYTKLCTQEPRNLSWNQWITECNNNINHVHWKPYKKTLSTNGHNWYKRVYAPSQQQLTKRWTLINNLPYLS